MLRANDCTINIYGLKILLCSLSSNYQLKILELKRNSFNQPINKGNLLDIRDQLYSFMLYNKTLFHLDLSDNQMDKNIMGMLKGVITPRQNFL